MPLLRRGADGYCRLVTLERWQRITQWPLTIAALTFLIVYGWSVIANLGGSMARTADAVTWVIWAVFVVDYVVSLVLAPFRRRWFVHHFLDLLIVALPALRALRLLRLLTLFRVLQKGTGTALRGRVTLYVIASASLLVLIGALGVLDAEQNASGSNIRSFGNAIWWAFATITTVGYGDYYPVTLSGRFIAVGMMIAGVALIGSVTATIASWVVEQVSLERNRDEQAPEHVEPTNN